MTTDQWPVQTKVLCGHASLTVMPCGPSLPLSASETTSRTRDTTSRVISRWHQEEGCAICVASHCLNPSVLRCVLLVLRVRLALVGHHPLVFIDCIFLSLLPLFSQQFLRERCEAITQRFIRLWCLTWQSSIVGLSPKVRFCFWDDVTTQPFDNCFLKSFVNEKHHDIMSIKCWQNLNVTFSFSPPQKPPAGHTPPSTNKKYARRITKPEAPQYLHWY